LFLLLLLCFAACTREAQPKYVFLFIGDGMGLAHASAAQAYLRAGSGKALCFTEFPVVGLATTYSASSPVTCSAAAATALATGSKTRNGMLGMSPDSTPLTALTYPLKAAGYKIGIATSVSIDHATPAGFYARAPRRSMYYEIAQQAAGTGFDFFGGSGFLRHENEILTGMAAAGYTILRGKQGAAQACSMPAKIVLVQDSAKPHDALPYAIDRQDDDLTLKEITQAAIAALQHGRGFFAMIEGGKIDWAAHDNDGAAVIKEVIDFGDAIEVALEFYKKHASETLIVVTADHETGGMSLGCCGVYDFRAQVFDEQKTAMSDSAADSLRAINARALCGWTTRSHTGIMVPVYAIGAGSQRMSGIMDNTDIPKRIMEIMQVKQ
jgi:alkaline phosphatase